MNKVPADGVPVLPEKLRALVYEVMTRAGLPDDKATLLSELLVQNDLRGVFSHGSRQITDYARLLRDGKLNPRPEVKVERESAVTMLVDGDGGLGYFPCWRAAHALVEKAKEHGV